MRISVVARIVVAALVCFAFPWSTKASADPFDEADPKVLAYCQETQSELRAGRFEQLETKLKDALDLGKHFIGGRPVFQIFVESVSGAACNAGICCYDDTSLQERMDEVEAWLKHSPNLPFVKVAMAKLWEYRGWLMGRSDTGWHIAIGQRKAFNAVLEKAQSFLSGIPPNDNPEVTLEALDLARQHREDRGVLDAIYQSGHESFPGYFTLYSHYANVLMPNLFGAPGELASFADSLSTDPGGDAGAVAYTFVAARLVRQYEFSAFYRKSGLSWDKIKHGYSVREKLYGLSNKDWNEYCFLAVAAGDRDVAKAAYEHFGDRWDATVWNPDFFKIQVVPWITGQ